MDFIVKASALCGCGALIPTARSLSLGFPLGIFPSVSFKSRRNNSEQATWLISGKASGTVSASAWKQGVALRSATTHEGLLPAQTLHHGHWTLPAARTATQSRSLPYSSLVSGHPPSACIALVMKSSVFSVEAYILSGQLTSLEERFFFDSDLGLSSGIQEL